MHEALQRELQRLGIDPEQGPQNAEQWQALRRGLDRVFAAGDDNRQRIAEQLDDHADQTRALYRELSALGAHRVEAERDKLASLLRAMTDGLAAFDAEGQLVFVNDAGQELAALLDVEDPTGFVLSTDDTGLFQREASDSRRGIDALVERTLAGQEIHRAEGWVQSTGRLRRYLSCVCSPVADGEGAVLTFRDESLQRLAAVQLEQAVLEACQAVEAKANFLANMSHEIRTPMNAVIGLTGLLLESQLDERQRRHAETVRSSGEALLGIINDILDYSKLDAGQVRLERIDSSLRECVDQVVDLLRQRARRAGLQLSVLVEAELPDLYSFDPGRLRQILLNLVGNAIKFTKQGGVHLHLGRGEQGVRFEVRDTGIGIPAEALDDVFQPFSQADASTTRRFGGTGLGLAISRQLVEAFGGKLQVESSPGQGSVFTFELPLAQGEAASDAPAHRRSLRQRSVLLVVEDDAARAGLSAHLQHMGVEDRSHASWPSEGRAGADLVVGDMQVPEDKHVDVRVGPPSAPGQELRELPHLDHPVGYARLARAMCRALGEDQPDSGILPAVVARETAPRRVLIVEDSVVNQLVAQELLGHMGVRCDVVGNGREAVEAVGRVNYDLVLMDISMPVMDGYQAATEIRMRGDHELPIVAMTANAMPEDVDRCHAVGMQAHLAKPVTLEKLRATLDAHFLSVPAAALPSRPRERAEGESA